MKPFDSNTYSRARQTAEATLAVAATLLVFGGVLYLSYLVRAILLDFILALIVAAALAPVVKFLQKRKFNRTWASVTALLLTIVILGGIITMIAKPLVTQGIKLVENAPEIFRSLSTNPKLTPTFDSLHVADRVQEISSQLLGKVTSSGSSAVVFAGTVLGGITTFLITLIFAFFILVDGPAAWKRLLNLFRAETAERVDLVGHKILKAVTGFVSGNLFISLIAGTVTLVVLLIFRVPYAFALAALVALFDLIPLVGATIATIFVALVALTKGIIVAVVIAAILFAYQFVENHFIQPLVYSRSVALSALLVIVATIAGAELMGLIGALIAIPVASVIQILVIEFVVGKKEAQ